MLITHWDRTATQCVCEAHHALGQYSNSVCEAHQVGTVQQHSVREAHHALGQYSNTVCVKRITRWDSTATQCV